MGENPDKQTDGYFKELIEKSVYMMLIMDEEGQLLHANKAFESILGYKITEHTGHKIWDFMDSYSKPHCAHQFKVATDGDQFDIELVFRTKDKELFFGEGSFHCVYDSLRNHKILMGVVNDKSALASFDLAYSNLERHLEEQSQLWQAIHRMSLNLMEVDVSAYDAVLNDALKVFGEMVYADRAFIMVYDIDKGFYSNTHEWCREGIMPKKNQLQNLPIEWSQPWILVHMKGDPIYVMDISKLEVDDIIRSTLAPHGVKSVISVPFFYDGILCGTIGFDSVKVNRTNSTFETEILRELGQLVVRALRKMNLLKL